MAREASHDFYDARRAPKEQARYTALRALETTEAGNRSPRGPGYRL